MPTRVSSPACRCGTAHAASSAFAREVLERIGIDGIRSNGYAFLVELEHLACCRGFRLTEIPTISSIAGSAARRTAWP
jgi:hypothetical protein